MNIPFNIVSLFFEQAALHPDRIALVEKHTAITFKQLDEDIRIIASMYRQNGIGKGDRVLVLIPMSKDLYKHVLALFYIGAIAVFLDAWSDRKRLLQCCGVVDCKALVGPKKFHWLSYLFSVTRKIKKRFPVVPSKKYDKVCDCIIEDSYPEDTALITFTTGSTGVPKATNRTHGFLKAQFDALIPLLKGRDENPDMPLLPIVLLLNLGLGETSIIADTNFSKPLKFEPEKLALQLRETECSSLSGSPWFILKLAEYCFHNRFEIKLKHIYTGGGPVSPEEATFLNAVFPKAKITVLYGSTEAEPISHINAVDLSKQLPEELISKGLWVGKVDANAQVKLVRLNESISDEDISRSEVKTGEVGEILVSGPHVLKEYWNNPEATRENKLKLGDVLWHRTGDCGRMDADGNLYLLGRCKWVFNYTGTDYYPFTIEYFMKTIPGVVAGCLLLKNKSPEFFLEVKKDFNETAAKAVLEKRGMNFPITILKNIPRDPRHLTKVDYESLSINSKN